MCSRLKTLSLSTPSIASMCDDPNAMALHRYSCTPCEQDSSLSKLRKLGHSELWGWNTSNFFRSSILFLILILFNFWATRYSFTLFIKTLNLINSLIRFKMQNKEVTVNKSKFHCKNMQTKNHILPLINKCHQPVNHNVCENRKNIF